MANSSNSSYRKQFIFLTSLFFLWGFITVLVDSLIPRLRELFTLSYFEAGLVQFAFFMAYFVLSIPAGYILTKTGYKKGIILGLLVMATGCFLFYPAAAFREFSIFLFAYFTLAGGMTILQVAANPFVAALGSEEGASSRLNLSQAFNSLGTTLAPIAGAIFILSDKIKTSEEIDLLNATAKTTYLSSEASAVQMPFLYIAGFILLMTLLFSMVKLPRLLPSDINNGGYFEALKNKKLVLGAIGIFLYVGAEVATGSYLINYFLNMNLVDSVKSSTLMSEIAQWILQADLALTDDKAIMAAFVTFYWSGAMVGRFIGSYLTRKFAPSMVLGTFALGAIGFILISILSGGFISMWSILLVGLFNSIMFPTIFTLSIDGLDSLKPQGSGILCTMIVGGAIIPPLFGLITDYAGFKLAFILIILCYGYIFFFSKIQSKLTQ